MRIFLLLMLFFVSAFSNADDVVIDSQFYPAGIITSLGYAWEFGNKDQVGLHLGFNKTDRKDFGKNDNEEGEGWGAGLSYRHQTSFLFDNFFWGARLDIWNLTIDWRDQGMVGETEITVIQPTLEAGLSWGLTSSLQLLTSLALGVEINTNQTGRDVGEGAIGLFRLGLAF